MLKNARIINYYFLISEGGYEDNEKSLSCLQAGWPHQAESQQFVKMERQGGFPGYAVPTTPPGLEAIYKACRRIYPDQPNPLQVTALVKYW